MLLFIDNFDSFTHNLVHYFEVLGEDVHVVRHNALTVDQCLALQPSHIILGPGPGDPSQAGISCDLIRAAAGHIPLLGICLGHQCIAEVYGAHVKRAERVMHGKTSAISHQQKELFRGLPQNFNACRYHSLIVDRNSLPDSLELTAWTEQGEVMALSHRSLPIHGIQFHPESVVTQYGHQLLANFLDRASLID